MHPRVSLIIGLFVALFASSQSTGAGFRIRTVTIQGERYLIFADVARFYGMQYRQGRESVVCRSRYSHMSFATGDRRAVVNGVQVMLSHPVKRTGGKAALSEADFRKTIDPLLRSKVLSGTGVRTIVIDPGHGGRDSGANGTIHQEKTINLAVARLAAYNLQRRGYRVYLTRTGDTKVSLSERAALAAKLNADVFVSLHVNSAGSSSARGIETYAVTPVGTSSTHSSDIKGEATPGNLHDRDNIRLAYELQKYLLRYSNAKDRGVKRANFVVIREAQCASALVEMGFISNRTEERLLGSSAHRRLLASGIVYGIVAYDQALKTQ